MVLTEIKQKQNSTEDTFLVGFSAAWAPPRSPLPSAALPNREQQTWASLVLGVISSTLKEDLTFMYWVGGRWGGRRGRVLDEVFMRLIVSQGTSWVPDRERGLKRAPSSPHRGRLRNALVFAGGTKHQRRWSCCWLVNKTPVSPHSPSSLNRWQFLQS